MAKSFRERFLEEAGDRPYAWAVAHGLSKDLVTAVTRGDDSYRPIRRTLKKIAESTGKSAHWWLTGEEISGDAPVAQEEAPVEQSAVVVGTIAGTSGRVDLRKLDSAIQALSQWERSHDISIPEEKRSAIIAILYDILAQDEADNEDRIATVFKVLS